ncbi:MAG: circadian clock protein KaiB [Chitinivibrionales bacterium]|nr:circadian clock protein KaiB [Chitinivibrionales bacterium]
MGPSARRAYDNLDRICREYLGCDYCIEVLDLTEQPERAAEDNIVALPTVVRRSPAPVRKVVGDMSLTEKVIRGLEVDVGSDRTTPKPVAQPDLNTKPAPDR